MSQKIWVKDQDGLGLYLCDNIGGRYKSEYDGAGNLMRCFSIVTVLASGKEAILWEGMALDGKEGVSLGDKRKYIVDAIEEQILTGCDHVSISDIEDVYKHRNDKYAGNSDFNYADIKKMRDDLNGFNN